MKHGWIEDMGFNLNDPTIKLMNDVFENRPNKTNVEQLLKMPVVQKLYWGNLCKRKVVMREELVRRS